MTTPPPGGFPSFSSAPQPPVTPGSGGGWQGADTPSAQTWTPAGAPESAWTQQGNWGVPPLAKDALRPVIPFRPLGLGELFSGAIEILRFAAAPLFLIPLVPMLILGVFEGFVTYWSFSSLDSFTRQLSYASADEVPRILSGFFLPLFSGLFISVVLIEIVSFLVMGPLYIISSDAVIRRKVDVREAFSRFWPRLIPMIGTAVLFTLMSFAIIVLASGIGMLPMIGVIGDVINDVEVTPGRIGVIVLVTLLCTLVAFLSLVFVQIRFLYAYPACTLEGLGPLPALKRSWELTRGVFWRTLGRYLLVSVAIAALTSILSSLMRLFFFGAPDLSLAFSAVLSALVSALTMPLLVSFLTLMYTDERMRRENFGVVLEQAYKARLG